jgi:hypothetical protein
MTLPISENLSKPAPSPVWTRAALLGSVWAALEIIVGSFLHNFRVPFTGTLLSAVGVSLLVAGHSLWPERGLIWRAGLICAAMKSISPSAVLLGPMIGIFTEALMIELAVRVLGRNVIGFLIGGALAVTVPLSQRIVSMLIAFGFNIALVFDGLYRYAAGKLGIVGVESYELLLLLYAIYAAFGVAAAVIGLFIARRARMLSGHALPPAAPDPSFAVQQSAKAERFALPLLFIHLVMIPAGMLLVSLVPLYVSATPVLAYAGWTVYRYPRAWRRLKRPSVWISILVAGLLAGVVLGKLSSDSPHAMFDGALAGAQMVVRAVLMTAAFCAVGVELRNPRVVAWFFRRGMGRLAVALDIAFASLPQMIAQLKVERGLPFRPIETPARLIAGAETWLQEASRADAERQTVPIFEILSKS